MPEQPTLRPELGARWTAAADTGAEAAFAALEAAGGDVVWLDSSSGGAHIIGTGDHTMLVREGQAFLDGEPIAGDAIDALEHARRVFPGAWLGWFGYEAGVRLLGLAPSPTRFPEAAWLRLDRWVVVDDGRAQLQSTGEPWSLPSPPPVPATTADAFPLDQLAWRSDDAGYAALVRRCGELIAAGEAYVLCLTSAITAPPIDPVATHLRLRASSPVHHGGFLRIAGTTVTSASPETFLEVRDGVAATRPIKGTRRRGEDAASDAALGRELASSEKERAENVMIVDLCRNDLSRVCELGSVTVTSLLSVETYPTAHQLVSGIRGRLRAGLGPLDAARVLFPAGSMTGAPKVRAVELLAELEGVGRGVYSGCFGVVAGDTCQLAMVIRSIVSDDAGCHIGVGGGITALSEPDFEVAELHLKAAPLLAALVPA
ncbi:anthranilate synthase component I family protein [Parenemella sanctibonifatiensis]|uniref:Chorismate-utilising enzyme C-terminal domain-containing protein n=1 Tax=Parenemella sanctibonifatiensis TaxID=2016505 RepID=A0A255E188_9ACTN|nr:anthranilate synthase component I family protein [Parenemella sanctibonifatiensis]OYN85304.1 hypothetical protein CGZ92_10910 [Parenemella sanctibonifatiensis]